MADTIHKPTFLIIGAGKSGTTSVYEYLRQHPDVFMSPVKETNFFAWDEYQSEDDRFFPVRSFDDYCQLFSGVRNETAIGEASPVYLYRPAVPGNISRHLPDVKLIAILRNPIERAFSSYLMYRNLGVEQRTFEQAIADEQDGLNSDRSSGQWHYLEAGLYARHLRRYLDVFDGNHLKVFLFDDLVAEVEAVVQSIFEFLDVDEGFSVDTHVRFNPTGVPGNRLIGWLFKKRPLTTAIKNRLPEPLRRRISAAVASVQSQNLSKPDLPADVRDQLVEYFRTDVQQLSELLNRDLEHWLGD